MSLVLVVGCVDDGGGAEPTFPELETLDTTPDPACVGTWVAGVKGRVVDEGGAGVGMAFPQMCVRVEGGSLNCLAPERARDDGWFARVINEESRCMSELNFRAFLPGSSFGTTYCRSGLRVDNGILSIPDPLVLYEVAPATDLPPEGDAMTERTVTFADGLELDVKPRPLFGMYSALGASRIDETTCFADNSFDGLYAFTPESLTFQLSVDGDPGFPFRIPTSLADGTRVDLFVLGGLDEFELATGTRLTEGAFEKFGTGTVMGGMVVNDEGSELPYLSWLGFRAQ